MRKIVHSDNAPAAVGPYSQGIRAGNLLFISGQLGLDMKTGEIAYGDVEAQTRQVLTNLETIAKAGGSSLANALKVSVYLTDMEDFAKMNAIYATFFPENPPARVCVEVSALPKGVQVEMDVICLCND
ncbi:MAG TPA: RidA family protein [Limnochordia bacterium]|jgi:2-iminobutanoate/2-iminopropanoate deaminase|nr:RidA family protein [Bacillota bacterium]HKM43002.1 RidA family protein [Limnochordia bacterium]